MENVSASTLLQFANLQMASEAFLVEGLDGGVIQSEDVIESRLVRGNTHARKFTPTQAAQFVRDYEVLAKFRSDAKLKEADEFSSREDS